MFKVKISFGFSSFHSILGSHSRAQMPNFIPAKMYGRGQGTDFEDIIDELSHNPKRFISERFYKIKSFKITKTCH